MNTIVASSREDEQQFFGVDLAIRLCELSPLGICLSDRAGRCIYANAAYLEITGLTIEKARGAQWGAALHPDDRERVHAEWLNAIPAWQAFHTEVRVQRADDRLVWARLHVSAVQGYGGSSAALVMVEDITERKATESILREAEEALFVEKERAQVTLDSIGDAVLATDLAGNVTYLNREAEILTGWSRAQALGQPLVRVFPIIDGTSRDTAPNPAQRAIAEDSTVELAMGCVLQRRDGTELGIEDSAAPIHDRDGAVTGAVIIFHDVARSLSVSERLSHEARHDHLTGLANTALLTERIDQVFSLAHRHNTLAALLFIDLDDFKAINDRYGHDYGDQVLKAVARRLGASVRASDTVCRRGGDEFLVLLSEVESAEDAAQVAEKILASISGTGLVDGHALKLRASIGISLFPDHGAGMDELVRRADFAMYQAKAGRKGGHCFAQRAPWRASTLPSKRGSAQIATNHPD